MPSVTCFVPRVVRVVVVLVLAAASLPAPAVAAQFFSGSRIVISQPDTLHDDIYAAGGNVVIRSAVDGDVVMAGGHLEIHGPIRGSVTAAGGEIQMFGPVGGSIRAAGGRLTFRGDVTGDLVAAGGRVSIEQANIGRDAVLSSGRVTLDGHVGRNVRAKVHELRLGEHASIAGRLDYVSEKALVQAPGAEIAGGITWQPKGPRIFRTLFGTVRWAIGLAFLGAILLLLFPAFTRRAVESLGRRAPISFGVGLVVLVVTPIVAGCVFLLGVLIGGWWIGAVLGMSFLLSLAIGFVLSAMGIGRWLVARMGGGPGRLFMGLLVSLVLFALVRWMPLLGPLVILIVALPGLGSLALNLGASMRASRHPPAQA